MQIQRVEYQDPCAPAAGSGASEADLQHRHAETSRAAVSKQARTEPNMEEDAIVEALWEKLQEPFTPLQRRTLEMHLQAACAVCGQDVTARAAVARENAEIAQARKELELNRARLARLSPA